MAVDSGFREGQAEVGQALVNGCTVTGNHGNGINGWSGDGAQLVVLDTEVGLNGRTGIGSTCMGYHLGVSVQRCRVVENGLHGVELASPQPNHRITNSQILSNGGCGISLDCTRHTPPPEHHQRWTITIIGNEIGYNSAGGIVGIAAFGPMVIADCLIFRNTGDGIDLDPYEFGFYPEVDILTTTVVANTGRGVAISDAVDRVGLERVLIASNEMEAADVEGVATLSVICTDIWDNTGGDWTGVLAPFLGQYDNISEDPWFCDTEEDDFTLHSDSPCAPFTPPNEECDLIGACPVGCGPMGLPSNSCVEGYGPLFSASPNPFVRTTHIAWARPDPTLGAAPRLGIYDAAGRLVRSLLSSPQPGGVHSALWDGCDQRRNRVGSGIYFARLQVGEQSLIRRLTLLR